jgi:hypothetical protein
MKNFVVISKEDSSDYFIVDNLNELINEMFEVDLMNGDSFDTVKGYFFNNYIVFESESEISEIDSPLFI